MEDARTNGRRGVPEKLGRLEGRAGASRNPNSRVQPESVPGGPIGQSSTSPRRPKGGGRGRGWFVAAVRGRASCGRFRRVLRRPGGSLPPPWTPTSLSLFAGKKT